MKRVSGKVLSSQPISLSKAAKLLSRFTASDNEASPAFAAYLRRTSAAFNQLVQIHKECKHPVGEIRDKKDRSVGVVTEGTYVKNEIGGVHGNEEMKKNVPDDVGAVGEKKSKKKTGIDHDAVNVGEVNKKMGSLDANAELKNGLPDVGGVDKKSKKKRKHENVADGELDDSVRSKKKKT